MKRVLKFPLKVQDHQVVKLPDDSIILSVINQRENIVMYVMVDESESNTSDIDIYIHGTGHEIDEKAGEYLGTVSLRGGELIFHIFAGLHQLYFNDNVCIKQVIPAKYL